MTVNKVMAKGGKIPERMCIMCRQMKPKKEMLRIVTDENGTLTVDITGKANGRGAYICTDESCRAKMKSAKILRKVFGANHGEDFSESVLDALSSLAEKTGGIEKCSVTSDKGGDNA